MRNKEQTVATKNTSTTNPTIQFTELSDEDAIRVVGGSLTVNTNITSLPTIGFLNRESTVRAKFSINGSINNG